MKRRSFLKGLFLFAAAPVVAKTLINDDEPVIVGVDLAKQGEDHTVSVWGVDSSEGGYMYSDELSEKLRSTMNQGFGLSPTQGRKLDQDAYNVLCNKRLDNVKLVNNNPIWRDPASF